MKFAVSALVLATYATAVPIADLSSNGLSKNVARRAAMASPTVKNGVVDTGAGSGPGDDWLTKRQGMH